MNRKILIVEDSFVFSEDLRTALEASGDYEVTDVIISYEDLKASLEANKPDFVLLDINLNGEGSGLDVAHDLVNKWEIPFMFITGQGDSFTFKKAIQYYPTHYIVKPCESNDVIMQIELALHNLDVVKNSPTIKKEKSFYEYVSGVKREVIVDVNKIIWVESRQHFVSFHIKDAYYLERSSMNEVIEELGSAFIQVHRNYSVNLKKIEACNAVEVEMIDGTKIPISRRFKKQLIESLK